MRPIIRITLALSLAASNLAFAQDSIDKSEMSDPRSSIDQNPVSVGDIALPNSGSTQSRTRINNTLSNYTDTNLGARNAPTQVRDVQQQQVVVGQAQRRTPGEFEKFVSENLGR